jgi:hypothetical protein
MKKLIFFLLVLLPIKSFSQVGMKTDVGFTTSEQIVMTSDVNFFKIDVIHQLCERCEYKTTINVVIRNLTDRIVYEKTSNDLPFYSTPSMLINLDDGIYSLHITMVGIDGVEIKKTGKLIKSDR